MDGSVSSGDDQAPVPPCRGPPRRALDVSGRLGNFHRDPDPSRRLGETGEAAARGAAGSLGIHQEVRHRREVYVWTPLPTRAIVRAVCTVVVATSAEGTLRPRISGGIDG